MIVEIGSTIVMGGIAGFAYLKSNGPAVNDGEKIQRIFANSGWTVREDGKIQTVRIRRKQKFEGGTEYVLQLPLGMSSKEIIDNQNVLADGLNVRTKVPFEMKDLLKLKWNKSLLKQLRELTNKKQDQKEIDISFDGMLRIKVYHSSLPEVIEWREDMLSKGAWRVPIGQSRERLVYHDFDKSKHLIVSSATGYGKSVAVKMMVANLIEQNPDYAEMNLIDLKGGASFHRFKDCKQTKRIARDPQEAYSVLKEVQKEMDATFKDIVDRGYEDIREAKEKRRRFIVIDEAADLADNSKAMDIVTDIARKGRSAGYYLIFSTQYPTAEVIPSQTKRNIIARLSYVVDTATASTVILDEGGAEKLPDIPGRGIYKNLRSTTVQTPFMSNEKIKERIKPYIRIRGKDEGSEQNRYEGAANRKHSIVIEKV
ncbi:FtsK/SpoIIIE domain-containing protein [Halobacillus salinus]|uniref:FtsK/SpoIIIE domain-containing protein n=1 Tax=Halobacillus salinus TaxID=192814 RepID=UPI0009A7FDA8|nr:FtsK/SpoIIIE domain-containing protein [Halobacillus salinus]